ncbi:hypothetical protein XENOCAPTIV_020890, partial [Xenoophorus captivus]
HISDGFIMLTAISRTNASQRIQLSGSITMPWRCEALEGAVEVRYVLTVYCFTLKENALSEYTVHS